MKVSIRRTNEEMTEIYRRHIDTVYRVCRMFLKNVPDTEDAVQSVFLKLIRSGPKFTDVEHEKAWLIVTAQNHCKNALKYWWTRKRSVGSRISEGFLVQKPPSGEVLEMLLALPEKYKIVLYLFYYEGYSSKEISNLLGIKDSTVRARLRNGRKHLQLNLTGGHRHEGRAIERLDGSSNAQRNAES
ncbi:RNA polymerase sigma factor [Paenibacillaceae bacterium WGS1546]|uniref:RNA polymerase sigma factor n=1 Tax=Cohnella sp. WGS1546 TaxID=3366810 RepID=UPI00372CFF5C